MKTVVFGEDNRRRRIHRAPREPNTRRRTLFVSHNSPFGAVGEIIKVETVGHFVINGIEVFTPRRWMDLYSYRLNEGFSDDDSYDRYLREAYGSDGIIYVHELMEVYPDLSCREVVFNVGNMEMEK